MDESCCSGKSCSTQDMAGKRISWLLWCLPTCLVILGAFWEGGRLWLWVPSLFVMGAACIVNAKQCHRLHCYITGPLYLIAGVYVVLAKFGYMPFQAGFFLLTVLVISVLAHLAELPFGRYLEGT